MDKTANPRATTHPRPSWPEGSREGAEALQRLLSISDREWHALKSQPRRRAAEQLASALVVLLAAEGTSQGKGTSNSQALALLDSAAAWLRGSQRDPGCPQHRR